MNQIVTGITQHRHHWFSCVWLLLICITLHNSVFAASRGEYEVKSAFIANFIILTEWPGDGGANSSKEITLCVVGNSSLPESFHALNGKQVGTKVLRVVPVAVETALPDCHVVFFMEDVDTEHLVRTLGALRSRPVLTIGEKSNVTKLGGTIHFFKDKGQLRFAINPKVLTEQRLKMSSRLLQIATLIND
ncbi:MAG: hypothetical protein ACI8ZB_001946 [Desulforhopalus sp.]|jgi:hypothetical protein